MLEILNKHYCWPINDYLLEKKAVAVPWLINSIGNSINRFLCSLIYRTNRFSDPYQQRAISVFSDYYTLKRRYQYSVSVRLLLKGQGKNTLWSHFDSIHKTGFTVLIKFSNYFEQNLNKDKFWLKISLLYFWIIMSAKEYAFLSLKIKNLSTKWGRNLENLCKRLNGEIRKQIKQCRSFFSVYILESRNNE